MLIAPKRLKLRTSCLTYVLPGTVRTWHPQIFPKCGVFKNLLGGDMHSHERLLVFNCFMRSVKYNALFPGTKIEREWLKSPDLELNKNWNYFFRLNMNYRIKRISELKIILIINNNSGRFGYHRTFQSDEKYFINSVEFSLSLMGYFNRTVNVDYFTWHCATMPIHVIS